MDSKDMTQSDVCEDESMEADFQLWEKKRKRTKRHNQRETDSSDKDQGDRDNKKVRNRTHACESEITTSESGSGAQQPSREPARSEGG